jgi:hypothetical protein
MQRTRFAFVVLTALTMVGSASAQTAGAGASSGIGSSTTAPGSGIGSSGPTSTTSPGPAVGNTLSPGDGIGTERRILPGSGQAGTTRTETNVPTRGSINPGIVDERTRGANSTVNQPQTLTTSRSPGGSGGSTTAGGRAAVPEDEKSRLAELMRRNKEAAQRATESICDGCLKD